MRSLSLLSACLSPAIMLFLSGQVHHWGSAQGQARRFEVSLPHLSVSRSLALSLSRSRSAASSLPQVLLEMAGPRQLRGASVADIGCGCGDLLAFLRRNVCHTDRLFRLPIMSA